MRAAFDEARAAGHSTVSRWTRDAEGRIGLAGWHVLAKPEAAEVAHDVAFHAGALHVSLRLPASLRASLDAYCRRHGMGRGPALLRAREAFPDLPDAPALRRLLEGEA